MTLRRCILLASCGTLSLACLATIWHTTSPVSPTAAYSNPQAPATISLTFDDGFASDVQIAAPLLRRYGLTATSYLISDFVGRPDYMNWHQAQQLQHSYGWELGSHTQSHRDMSTLDSAQLETELRGSQHAFAEHGITATEFASPQGDYNPKALAAIARHYRSHRTFHDVGDNDLPYNPYLLYTMPVGPETPPEQVFAKIDAAIAGHHWLILTFHQIVAHPSSNPHLYQYSPDELARIAAYIRHKQLGGQLRSVSIAQGRTLSGHDMFAVHSFELGWPAGWTTDAPNHIRLDYAYHGSYPMAATSLHLSGDAAASHVYSPQLTVSATHNYVLQSYLSVDKIDSHDGSIEYYVAEYDANGKALPGQFIRAERNVFSEELNVVYHPSGPNVHAARLEITVLGAGTSAYLDNVRWLAQP